MKKSLGGKKGYGYTVQTLQAVELGLVPAILSLSSSSVGYLLLEKGITETVLEFLSDRLGYSYRCTYIPTQAGSVMFLLCRLERDRRAEKKKNVLVFRSKVFPLSVDWPLVGHVFSVCCSRSLPLYVASVVL